MVTSGEVFAYKGEEVFDIIIDTRLGFKQQLIGSQILKTTTALYQKFENEFISL